MGKYAVNIMIILTGIIVLAHTAIPHHHHQGKVCIETERNECSTFPNTQDTSDHNHHHDPQNNFTRCFITEFVPASSKNTYRLNASEYVYNKYFPSLNNFILSEGSRISTFFSKTLIPETNFLLSYKSVVHFTSGLRAPPIA